jgi:hypothetical protein
MGLSRNAASCGSTQRKGLGHSYYFGIQPQNSTEIHTLTGDNLAYKDRYVCRGEGALRYAFTNNIVAMTDFILNILHSYNAQRQIRSRPYTPTGEYFLLHDNNRRGHGKRLVLAVARKLSHTRFFLALYNNRYLTDEMDYFCLDRA